MAKTDFQADPDNDDRDLTFCPADRSAATTLSSSQVDHYNEYGFVGHLPVYSASEATAMRDYVSSLVTDVVKAPDQRNSYSINAYHMVCAGLYEVILTPSILDLVQDIIGPNIVCWGQHLFCKQPYDPMEVPLHQDAVYWPLTPARSVTVWIALDDADEANAAMQFAPGTHRLGPLDHEEKPLDGSRVLKRQVCDPVQFGPRVFNELRAGEVSLHSDMLLHGSSANQSSRRRAGLTIRYAASEVRTVPGAEYWVIPAVHCRGTIDDFWPHWTRPAGEHPEKMAAIFGDFDGNPAPDAG